MQHPKQSQSKTALLEVTPGEPTAAPLLDEYDLTVHSCKALLVPCAPSSLPIELRGHSFGVLHPMGLTHLHPLHLRVDGVHCAVLSGRRLLPWLSCTRDTAKSPRGWGSSRTPTTLSSCPQGTPRDSQCFPCWIQPRRSCLAEGSLAWWVCHCSGAKGTLQKGALQGCCSLELGRRSRFPFDTIREVLHLHRALEVTYQAKPVSMSLFLRLLSFLPFTPGLKRAGPTQPFPPRSRVPPT